MSAPPLPFVWSDGAFRPHGRFAAQAARQYGDGELVVLAPVEERSEVSHRHEFAWLREAWLNLPEHLADNFPTVEHLRKRALIDAGFYDEQVIDAGTAAAALRVAAGLRARPGESFSLVIVRGPAVVIRTAKSQSRRAMDKQEFQASKTAIIETVEAIIGAPIPGARQPQIPSDHRDPSLSAGQGGRALAGDEPATQRARTPSSTDQRPGEPKKLVGGQVAA